MPNGENNVEKALDEPQVEEYQGEQNVLDIQDCMSKAIRQYLTEHPCEGCMYTVLENLPAYTPPPEGGNTPDDALENQLNQIAEAVKSQMAKCHSELKKSKQRWRIDCLCILTMRLVIEYDYDNREMGIIFGITEDAVRQRKHRCLKSLFKWSAQNNQPDFKTCLDQIRE
jgi:hypothetical protein